MRINCIRVYACIYMCICMYMCVRVYTYIIRMLSQFLKGASKGSELPNKSSMHKNIKNNVKTFYSFKGFNKLSFDHACKNLSGNIVLVKSV